MVWACSGTPRYHHGYIGQERIGNESCQDECKGNPDFMMSELAYTEENKRRQSKLMRTSASSLMPYISQPHAAITLTIMLSSSTALLSVLNLHPSLVTSLRFAPPQLLFHPLIQPPLLTPYLSHYPLPLHTILTTSQQSPTCLLGRFHRRREKRDRLRGGECVR